jgi:hypothetical protein
MEFIITVFHFHKGRDIDNIIFGKRLNENHINEDIRIFPSGGLLKDGGIQEKYLKINMKNKNEFNLDLLSDFLANRLSPLDDADSIKIGDVKVKLKKNEIKKALQIYLNEI